MTESNIQSPTDKENEKIIDSLKYEISNLKFQLTKRDDRIASLDAMLNQVMESHNAEVRAYEDLKDKMEDMIEMLRKRTPHGDILDHLKVKDSNEYQFKKLW